MAQSTFPKPVDQEIKNLDSKIITHNFGDYSSLSSLEADLTSYGNSLSDSEKRNIKIAVTSAFGLFRSLDIYIGTICKKETDRFIIQLQTTASSSYAPILGLKSIGGTWIWDELALNSKIGDLNVISDPSIYKSAFNDIPINCIGRFGLNSSISPVNSSEVFAIIATGSSLNYRQIEAISTSRNKHYIISCNNGTWSSWEELALNSNIQNISKGKRYHVYGVATAVQATEIRFFLPLTNYDGTANVTVHAFGVTNIWSASEGASHVTVIGNTSGGVAFKATGDSGTFVPTASYYYDLDVTISL